MAKTRITLSTKPGGLYDSQVWVEPRPDGFWNLTIEKPDGTDLVRTALSGPEAEALRAQLTPAPPEPPPEPPPPPSEPGTTPVAVKAGQVAFARAMESSFDAYTSDPTAEQKAWMVAHYHRARVYSPFFDSRLAWFPNGWVYQDLYAIYRNSATVTEHPDWILKDSAGNKLYIPFGCSGGTCPQYAADFGHPEFRTWWIDNAKGRLAKGYAGLFVDDVNMDFRVSDGTGTHVAPIDPRTGQAMTIDVWRRYMVEFLEQIRAATTREIVHNCPWWFGAEQLSDPLIQRQLAAADYQEFERGVNDSGIRGGGGRFGFETLLAKIDYLHSKGRGVVFDAKATTNAGREYGLAAYLLVNDGGDLLGNDQGGKPDDWWAGYDVNLGDAKGPRYTWEGLLRRDFAGGVALLNQPGATTKTVELGGTYRRLDGTQATSITLAAAQGAVLVPVAAPTLPPPPPPSGRQTWVPTDPSKPPARGDFPTLATAGLLDSAILVRKAAFNPVAGQTYENLDIEGEFYPAAGNVFRNCRFSSSAWWVVRCESGTPRFEDCELVGNGWGNAIVLCGSGANFQRCYFHGMEDAMKASNNLVLQDCLLINNVSTQPGPHYDGVQSMGGRNLLFRHNYIELPALEGGTSCVLLKTDSGPISDVVVEYNYLNGGSHTFTTDDGGGGSPSNVQVRYNRFGRRHTFGPLNIDPGTTLTGNVWDDTGSPMP